MVVVGARRTGMVAVVLAALTMGLAFAHTLELPQKLDYDPATWTQLQHSLYRYFAVIGGPLEVATVIAAVVFAVRARGLRGGRLAVVGAVCFVLALGWWIAVVNTANAEVGSLDGGCGALGLASLAGPVGVRTRRPLCGDVRRVPGAAGCHRACRRPGSPACPWSLLAIARLRPAHQLPTWGGSPTVDVVVR